MSSLQDARARLQDLEKTGNQSTFLEYIGLAARLAALGFREPLKGWYHLAKTWNVDFLALLTEFVERLNRSFDSGSDDFQDLFIRAWDLHCFVLLEKDLLPEAALYLHTDIKELTTKVNGKSLNFVFEFLSAFPLPGGFRFPAMDPLLTTLDREVLDRQILPPPAEFLIFRKGRYMSVKTPNGAHLGVNRDLSLNYYFRVLFSKDPRNPPKVKRVSLGGMPLYPSVLDSSFELDLEPLTSQQRLDVLQHYLTIELEDPSYVFTLE